MSSEQQRFRKQGTSPEMMELVFLDEITSRLADSQTEIGKLKILIAQLALNTDKQLKQSTVNIDKQLRQLLEFEALKHAEEFAYPFPWDLLYQYKTVAAGESDTVVWTMDLRESGALMSPYYVGVITTVANSWYENTHLTWKIDYDEAPTENVRILNRTVEEALGDMDTPLDLKPRYIITNKCEWTATNDDSASHVFWVYMRGYFILKGTYKKLSEFLLGRPIEKILDGLNVQH